MSSRAEPRSALCLLSMALMLLSAAARLWYYLADPVATAMTLSQADIFLLVGLPVFPGHGQARVDPVPLRGLERALCRTAERL